MSIANLEVPNNFDLFCHSLTANTLNIDHETINNLTVTGTLDVVTEVITGTLFSIPTNHTGIAITNQASPLNAALLFVDNTIDSSASVIPIAGFVSNQLTSSIDVRNNNAASTSNSIVFHDNAGNPSLQVGSNNFTSTAYVLSGAGDNLNVTAAGSLKLGANGASQYTISNSPAGAITSTVPLNLNFPGYLQLYWTTSTNGAVSSVVPIFTPSVNTTYTMDTICQGTSGAGSVSFKFTTRFVNFAGITPNPNGGVLVTNTNNDGVSLTACTAIHTTDGAVLRVTVTGQAPFTIAWSGVTTIAY
jgi:hypothetical protein